MPKDQAYYEAEKKIRQAMTSRATELDLRDMKLTELPESIGQLKQLRKLDLGRYYSKNESENNQLTALPDSIGQLTQLTSLNLSGNQLTALPDSLGQLTQLTSLDLSSNQLTTLPDSLGQLTQLEVLQISDNTLTPFPISITYLKNLKGLYINGNKLTEIPSDFSRLESLTNLELGRNLFSSFPRSVQNCRNLTRLMLHNNSIKKIPDSISELRNITELLLHENQINEIPSSLAQLEHLKTLALDNNQLTDLPPSLAQLKHLNNLDLDDNPLNPALQSAYDACKKHGTKHEDYAPLWAYLRSLEQNAEPLYEAKLVLVGEGNVGKTTLLKALKGKKGKAAPKKDEATTHGVEIDIRALHLPHPTKKKVKIQLNAWDFGGQDVYRVTHQFFFSKRSLYLLVWEPRRGVQQGQVEDWLNMIRLRVGDEARVIIVSTHCKTGERIARIDQPVFQAQYGDMIVGFHEVDSLVPDPATGEMTGIAELKQVIASEAAKLKQMGMGFNRDWKAARDELLALPEPRISFASPSGGETFSGICASHGLSGIDTETLAHLMHDLGYIVHYADDEKLRDDVVLKPEWLTKAIGFVLENRATAEREGILPDGELYNVWHDHAFPNEPRYEPSLYPFFLRLMEKYDVSYRLPEGDASLVAQHVPQVRPNLPWLPEQEPPKNLRRIAMVCSMEEDPPGLVPWMIVRTHDYSVEQGCHHLHWQKGVFLCHEPHGEAMLEKRGREFHVYAQATYPEYFMNVLQETLQKLIKDNWPGMQGRYRFTVPCSTQVDGKPCKGRFNIQALRQFISNGVQEYPCQECFQSHPIRKLLSGLELPPVDVQLREINERLAGLDSRIAHYFMSLMNAIADEAKNGPRLFTFTGADAKWSLQQPFSRPMKLHLWCEAEGCQHPVGEEGKGVYEIKQTREWVTKIAPYAKFVLSVLKTVAPMANPAINSFFGPKTNEKWGIKDQLDLAKAITDKLPKEIMDSDRDALQRDMLSRPERSGILAFHALLRELDPSQAKLGLHRIPTYTGDYRWLCKKHYDAWQPNIPDEIQSPG